MQISYDLDNNNLGENGCREIADAQWHNLRTINLNTSFYRQITMVLKMLDASPCPLKLGLIFKSSI